MRATAAVRDGWVVVSPYEGPELAPISIAVGSQDEWKPAFLDWVDGARVAKIRQPAPTGRPAQVWLRVGETVTSAGKVTI
ncbi:hypothetical protein ACFY05_41940 [Microtetraspora fusca]|uniref:Uncharacterized protein n=1 Tax=Microtetraspora fusca TaxID=1997 RepID=A0ABW6VJ63_MICFU